MKMFTIHNKQPDGTINSVIFPAKTISYINLCGNQILLSFNNKETITITGDNVKQIADELTKVLEDEK